MKEEDYDYDNEENVVGVVSIVAYDNNTYVIRTDMEAEDLVQLVVEAGDDLLEGKVQGMEDISHCGNTKH